MASNEVTLFQPGAALPAHVANFFDDAGANIQDRQTVPSLSPQGKMWTISLNGTKTKLERKNTDGDMEPVGVMKVVILDYAQRRGRAYYEGEYDPAKESAPVCWSEDGITPDDSLPPPLPVGAQATPGKPRKICETCASCPMAVKGSKITAQNKAVTACGQHRMLAVVPAFKLDFQPLRLKIAMTSDYDALSPDMEAQGWMAFSNYKDWLNSRGVKHTAALVTKMKFDANAAYPKIFFAADRWLETNEIAQIAPLTKDPDVQKLLGGHFTPAGVDGVPKGDAIPAPEGNAPAPIAGAATPASTAAPPAASPSPAPTADDDDGDIVMTPALAAGTAPQPPQEPAQASKPPPEAEPPVEDPPAAAAAAAAAAPAVSTEVPDDVAALMKEWQ